MARYPGLTRQIVQVLKSCARYGASRHAAKRAGTAATGIYSTSSMQTHITRCCTLFRSLPPAARPRMLSAWTPEHTRQMIQAAEARGLAPTTLRNYVSSLRKLAVAVHRKRWTALAPEVLVPHALQVPYRARRVRGGYSPEVAAAVLARLAATEPDVALVQLARLIAASGLRAQEASLVREQDLDRTQGRITVCATHAKGGRVRVVDLRHDPAGQATLQAALADLPPGGHYVWPQGRAVAQRLRLRLRQICAELGVAGKGMHGLRATFAEGYLRRQLAAGQGEEAARDRLALLLGHTRRQVTYCYVPRLTPFSRI